MGLHDLRTKQSDHMQFIQLHLEIQGDMRLLQAHDIAKALELRIIEAFPYANIIIHLDPID